MRDLSEVGVLLLMFVAGLETDLVQMRRVGKVAFWSAFGGVLLPLIFGAATASAFGFPLYWEGIFIGTILTATSVSISAQTLLGDRCAALARGRHDPGRRGHRRRDGDHPAVVVVALAKASASGVDVLQIGIVALRVIVYFALAIGLGRVLRGSSRGRGRCP
jgi:Kef-type K+ transport system membrane component KefB